jgi:dihydrofolate reductase
MKTKSNQMRKLIYAINLTLDGCCDHTKVMPDEELYDHYIALLRSSDTFLYGRKTYQLMVPYWPDVAKDHSGHSKGGNDYADAFIGVEHMVVVSRTLDNTEGKNIRIIRENLHDEVLKLKQEPGKNILTGGADVASQLTELGLIDEYYILVQPVIVGEGRRLFDGASLPEKLQLKLVDTKVFKSGNIALKYLKS